MAIAHFHYLVTTFCLTVWTRAPTFVLAVAWAFQAILFISGIATPDLADYIFWQFFTSFVGMVLGVTLFSVTQAPMLLRALPAYTDAWIKFLCWFILFLAAQLFYGFFRPPSTPGGLLGTVGAHVVLSLIVWWWFVWTDGKRQPSSGDVVFRDYLGRRYLFVLWTVSLAVTELGFFLTYAIADEKWSAYAAAAMGAVVIIIAAVFWPLKPAYRTTVVSSASIPILETGFEENDNDIPL